LQALPETTALMVVSLTTLKLVAGKTGRDLGDAG
jgi:hypothetical protein